MLKWFDAKEEQAFGRSIAEFYVERVPFEAPFSTKKFAAKTQETLKKIDRKKKEVHVTLPEGLLDIYL